MIKIMKDRFKPKFNIVKGSQVVVIAGDDKDLKRPRKVLAVYLHKARVLVEGANKVKKHMKPTAQNTTGQIIEKEAPIHISNLMLWDEKAQAPTRITRVREGKLVKKVSKKTGEIIK